MKKLILLLLLIPVIGMGQLKKNIPSYICAFVAGVADGVNQTITYDWKGWKDKFPNSSTHYWWPSKSYENKYRNGDRAQGERFWGSSSIFVFITDGYHLTRFVEHLSWAACVTFKLGEKKKWWLYIIDGASYWLINRAGMSITYNLFKL